MKKTSFEKYYALPSPAAACELAADNHSSQRIADLDFAGNLRKAARLCREHAQMSAILSRVHFAMTDPEGDPGPEFDKLETEIAALLAMVQA